MFHRHIYACTEIRGQRLEVSFGRCSSECCSPWFLRQDLSLTTDLELAYLVKLISQGAPEIHLSLPPSSGITSSSHMSQFYFI